jgi:DNA primase
MLRVAGLPAARRLDLRVAVLPAGSDPADFLRAEGAEAMRAIVDGAVAFVRFRVERVLAGADLASPEGRDRALGELRPALAGVPPGAMQQELVRLVAGRLGLSEALAASLLAARAAPAAARPAGAALDRREEAERHFLALCVALPDVGAELLGNLDLDRHLTGALERRGAAHLRAHLHAPSEGIAGEDRALVELIAELTVRAGREQHSRIELEVEVLQLELARIDREIRAARVDGRGDVVALARERDRVRREMNRALDEVMQAGRGG